ncbi:hypothetical protein ZIOFF_013433 [Zingiber officinale]|uniref:TRF2/HOY1 PH-like domain-containing protein n=1 Tax=Zingiber officinale TaxID=94328 RepID=A0A8J5HG19_ZINOF|nr:hypothetical protein ZIOFF_013433 [Zingiber officinale]
MIVAYNGRWSDEGDDWDGGGIVRMKNGRGGCSDAGYRNFSRVIHIPPPLFLRNTSTRSKRKSYGEAAELGVLGFLLWISSGGMVWSLDFGKRRADSTQHSAPPPPAMKLEVEEPFDEKCVRLHKRAMDASTSLEQDLYNNMLGETRPLDLCLGRTETRDSFGRTLDFDSQDTPSPCSVEELASGNTSLSCDTLFDKEIMDFIPQFFDNDSQSFAASDEQSIISRGNSLYYLLQQNTVGEMYSVLKDQSDFKSHINDFIKDDSRTTFSGFYEPGPPCATSSISNKTETRDSFERTLDFDSQDTPSPCSVEELASGNTSLGNSLCCLLQQNTVGGMVWSLDSGKRRADSTQHSTPPPPAVKLEVEEPLDEKRVRLHKRIRDASTSCEQALYNNVLGEPRPLCLRPRKSRSLADMSQMMLSQANAGKTLCFTSSKGSEVGEQSDFSASSSSLSKINASNFPTSLLRIGTWKCVSRYEGDLVAKCYFAKHKLVWEVLEGGLKCKIEFHCSLLQLRKYFLKTLLSKNFEKLIDCDPQLKILSQQPDIILESPYFNPQYSVLEDQSDSKSHINDFIKDNCRTTFSGFYEPGPPCATSSISNKTETRDSFGRTLDFDSQDTTSPSSVEELASGNTSLSCDALFDKEITHFIPQFFDNDSQFSAASDEQSIISRDNSLCCLLLQNTVGGMVWSSDFGKRRADSTQHSTPPPPAVKLEVEEPLDEKRVRLHKRIRDASTSCEKALYNNVLGELGPLGLRPRKNRSLADISQMMLSQANAGPGSWCTIRLLSFFELIEKDQSFEFSALIIEDWDMETLLSKNFEKLIDCDPQLKLLSQQPDMTLESSYFNPQYSVLEDQSDSKSHINDFIKDDSRTTFSGFYEPGPPYATSSISNKTETRDFFGRTLDFDSQDTTSPSSVEELASGNTSLSCDALFDKEITNFIPQFFDNDSQSSAASDAQSIISRDNSLCCLLQQNTMGGMVWSLDSGKRRADSTQHSTPPPPAVKLEVEEPMDEKRVRLHKRIRDASTSKSQSLADMSQMMLSQANAGAHGTLDIVLARPPLFFRATDPQLRKHTPTLTIADFFFPVHLARRDKLDNVRKPKNDNIMTQVLGSRSRYVKGLGPLPKLSVVGGSRATKFSSKHHDDYGKFATMKKTIDEQNLTIPSTNMLFNSTSSATSPAFIIDYVALYNNVLGEPGPLGLLPRKSRSLADISQMMFSQTKAGAIPFAAYCSKIQWAEWFDLQIPASAELIPPSTRICLLGGEVGSGGIQEF